MFSAHLCEAKNIVHEGRNQSKKEESPPLVFAEGGVL